MPAALWLPTGQNSYVPFLTVIVTLPGPARVHSAPRFSLPLPSISTACGVP